MAVRELSVGPVYVAFPRLNRAFIPVQRIGVVQMKPPFREGKAVLVSFLPFVGVAVGWWKKVERSIQSEAPELLEFAWLNPKWVVPDFVAIRGAGETTEAEGG